MSSEGLIQDAADISGATCMEDVRFGKNRVDGSRLRQVGLVGMYTTKCVNHDRLLY